MRVRAGRRRLQPIAINLTYRARICHCEGAEATAAIHRVLPEGWSQSASLVRHDKRREVNDAIQPRLTLSVLWHCVRCGRLARGITHANVADRPFMPIRLQGGRNDRPWSETSLLVGDSRRNNCPQAVSHLQAGKAHLESKLESDVNQVIPTSRAIWTIVETPLAHARSYRQSKTQMTLV